MDETSALPGLAPALVSGTAPRRAASALVSGPAASGEEKEERKRERLPLLPSVVVLARVRVPSTHCQKGRKEDSQL